MKVYYGTNDQDVRDGVFFYVNMDETTTAREAKKEGTPSKAFLQSYLQNFTKEAIDSLVEIMRTSRNENLKMGAAKVILDKSLPTLNGLTDANGESIKLNIISGTDYISAVGKLTPSSTASALYGSAKIQGEEMSQEVQNA